MNIKPILLATLVLLPLTAHSLEPYQLSAKIEAFRSLAQTCEIHASLEYGDWRSDCLRALELLESLATDFESNPRLTVTDERKLTSGMQAIETVSYLKGWSK